MTGHNYSKGQVGPGSARIIALAERPDGVTSVQLEDLFPGKDLMWRHGKLGKLVAIGHLVRCKLPGAPVHFFRDREAAAAWVHRKTQVVMMLPSRPPKLAKITPARNPKPRVRPDVAPPVSIKASAQFAAAVATLAPDCKVTTQLMPAYDLRYQVDPATRVVGGFATMGIGRYVE